MSWCKIEHLFLRCPVLQSKRATCENQLLYFSPQTHYKVEYQFLRCALLQSERGTFDNQPLQIYWNVCTKRTFEVILVRKSQANPPDRPNNPTGGWTGTIYSLETRISGRGRDGDRDRDRDQQNHSIAEYTHALRELPPIPSSLLICTSSRPPLSIILSRLGVHYGALAPWVGTPRSASSYNYIAQRQNFWSLVPDFWLVVST